MPKVPDRKKNENPLDNIVNEPRVLEAFKQYLVNRYGVAEGQKDLSVDKNAYEEPTYPQVLKHNLPQAIFDFTLALTEATGESISPEILMLRLYRAGQKKDRDL